MDWSREEAIPKSRRTAAPEAWIMMLLGLTSRWQMPREWASLRELLTPWMIDTTSATPMLPRRSRSLRDSPVITGMTM